MRIMTITKITVLTILLLTNVSLLSARTIVLIYDDSISMQSKCIVKKDKKCIKREYYLKYAYANYAAQMLTAYLKKTDKFIPLLMSKFDKTNPSDIQDKRQQSNEFEKNNPLNIQDNRQQSIDHIKQNCGKNGACTKYIAVQQGFKTLIEDDDFSNEKEQHFLIIMTDGSFEGKCNNSVDPSVVEKHSIESIEKSKGRIKVIFLLIGKETKNQPTFVSWEKNAPPNQVRPYFAENEKEIITQMKKIAKLITGMETIKFENLPDSPNRIQGNTIQFKTILPLNRITVSLQTTRNSPPQIQNVFYSNNTIVSNIESEHLTISYDAKREKPVTNADNEVHLKAYVTHYKSPNFLAGDYTIILDKSLTQDEKENIQILLETAVKTNIKILDIEGKPLNPINGEIKVCKDDLLQAGISFQDPGGEIIPFSPDMTEKIDIGVFFDKSEYKIAKPYNYKNKMFITNNFFTVHQHKTNFYAEVVYPQYFSYKSNVISIIGVNCAQKIVKNPEETVNVSYVMSDTPEPVSDTISFTITSIGESEYSPGCKDTIEVFGMPPGLMFRIHSKNITPSSNKISIPMLRNKDQLPVQILRNKDFGLTDSVKVHLKLYPYKKLKYQWKNYPVITIQPQARKINIISPSVWKVPVDQLEDEYSFLTIAVQLNDQGIPREEFQQWQIYCDDFVWLPVDTFKDQSSLFFKVVPQHPFNCQCFTATGVMDMTCKIQGVFQKEVYTVPIKLDITDISLIKKCYGLAIIILILIIIIWWIIGFLKKPRFKEGRCITYKVIENKREIKYRTEALVSHKFKRWVIPYFSEKKEIRSFTFYPGPFNTIMISKKQMRKNIYVDGIVQDLPWQNDLKLNLNSTLTHDHGDRKELYIYN